EKAPGQTWRVRHRSRCSRLALSRCSVAVVSACPERSRTEPPKKDKTELTELIKDQRQQNPTSIEQPRKFPLRSPTTSELILSHVLQSGTQPSRLCPETTGETPVFRFPVSAFR